MMKLGPLKRIVGRYRMTGHYGCNQGTWSTRLTLECGHEVWVKGSKEPKRQARCQRCGPGGDQYVETWPDGPPKGGRQ